jgi:hypothetical protein
MDAATDDEVGRQRMRAAWTGARCQIRITAGAPRPTTR